MRYVAAYMLATLGGNKAPTEADLKKILGSVEGEYSDEQSKLVVSQLNGKSLEELVAAGSAKLATIPSGGGGAAAGGASASDSKADAPEEAKKEEDEESEDGDMGFGLFD